MTVSLVCNWLLYKEDTVNLKPKKPNLKLKDDTNISQFFSPHTYPFFSHQELAFSVLLLDVVILHFHLMGELQPLLKRLWRWPATSWLQLLLSFLQCHSHLQQMSNLRAQININYIHLSYETTVWGYQILCVRVTISDYSHCLKSFSYFLLLL